MLSRAPIAENSVRHDVALRVEGDNLVSKFSQCSLPLTALRRINIYLLTCPDVSKVNLERLSSAPHGHGFLGQFDEGRKGSENGHFPAYDASLLKVHFKGYFTACMCTFLPK